MLFGRSRPRQPEGVNEPDEAASSDGANPPPEPGVWAVLRPFVAFAAVLVLIAQPPVNAIAQVALALAGAALLFCVFPRPTPAERAAEADEAGAWSRAGRVLLVCGGIAALLGPFLYSNPTNWSIGAPEWPWTTWLAGRRWQPRLDVAALVLAGAVAVAAGTRRRGVTALATLALALAAFVTIRGYAKRPGGAAGPLDFASLGRVNLLWAVCAAALGGALLHLGSSSRVRRGVARATVVAAVLGIASVYVAWFPESGGGQHASVAYYVEELDILLGVVTRQIEVDPTTAEANRHQFWAVGVPFLCQTASLAIALVVAAVPSASRSRLLRWAAIVAWLLLLATWIVPPRADAWFRRDVPMIGARVAQFVGETVMRAGLAIWLIASGAIAALLARPGSLRGEESRSVAAAPRRAVGVPRWRAVLYAGAVALSLIVMRTSFDPQYGVVARSSVRDLLATASWDAAFMSLVFQSSFTLAALAAAFHVGVRPDSRVRAFLMLVVAGIAIAALTPTGEGRKSFTGVDWFVPPTLAVLGAGLAFPRDGVAEFGRRAAAVTASAIVLLLLVYPDFADAERTPGTAGVVLMPFRSKLFTDTIGGLGSASSAEEFVRVLGLGGLMALSFAATAILAIAAAFARSRRLAVAAAIVIVVGGLVGPAVLLTVGTAGGGSTISKASFLTAMRFTAEARGQGLFASVGAVVRTGLEFLPSAFLLLGDRLRILAVPYLIALLAALLDLGCGRESPAPSATPAGSPTSAAALPVGGVRNRADDRHGLTAT